MGCHRYFFDDNQKADRLSLGEIRFAKVERLPRAAPRQSKTGAAVAIIVNDSAPVAHANALETDT